MNTPASFIVLFPEFAAQSPARIQLFLTMAANRMNPIAWGLLFNDAQNYLAAHLLYRANLVGHGPVIGQTVGNLSQQYAATSGLGYKWTDYSTTPYGLEYLELCSTVGPTPAVTG